MMNMMIKVSSGINGIFSSTKRDPGGIGFIDDVGGNVDGLMSCTESLGFESSDERRVDDRFETMNSVDELLCSKKEPIVYSRLRGKDVKKEVKKFPPPLSSLSQDGRPTFFLRPVRGDGRLKLTEVKLGRQEILRASRQDGRLRLHLIRDEDDQDGDIQEETQEEEEEEEEEEEMQDIQKGIIQEKVEENAQLETTEEITEEEVKEKEEELERVQGWQFPAGGGGDAFRRCNEQVSRHPHHGHQQHVWRQHFVAIR